MREEHMDELKAQLSFFYGVITPSLQVGLWGGDIHRHTSLMEKDEMSWVFLWIHHVPSWHRYFRCFTLQLFPCSFSFTKGGNTSHKCLLLISHFLFHFLCCVWFIYFNGSLFICLSLSVYHTHSLFASHILPLLFLLSSSLSVSFPFILSFLLWVSLVLSLFFLSQYFSICLFFYFSSISLSHSLSLIPILYLSVSFLLSPPRPTEHYPSALSHPHICISMLYSSRSEEWGNIPDWYSGLPKGWQKMNWQCDLLRLPSCSQCLIRLLRVNSYCSIEVCVCVCVYISCALDSGTLVCLVALSLRGHLHNTVCCMSVCPDTVFY